MVYLVVILQKDVYNTQQDNIDSQSYYNTQLNFFNNQIHPIKKYKFKTNI
jgi:hypothetical protein